jgi:hypothetical protein
MDTRRRKGYPVDLVPVSIHLGKLFILFGKGIITSRRESGARSGPRCLSRQGGFVAQLRGSESCMTMAEASKEVHESRMALK